MAISKQAAKAVGGIKDLGDQLSFHGRAYSHAPHVIRHYRKEVVRLLAEVSLGSGALAMIGGTVLVTLIIEQTYWAMERGSCRGSRGGGTAAPGRRSVESVILTRTRPP